jgi:hypothetical protein
MPRGRQQPRKREQAIANLLTAPSIEEAARRTGVSDKTLRLWLGQPDFAQLYRRARQQVLEHAVGILQATSRQAVEALVRNLSCGRPGAEIAAANHLLEKSLQAVEQFDVLTRLEALEARAAQQGAAYAYRNGQTTSRGPDR